MFTYLKEDEAGAVDVEDIATDLANAVAHLRAVVLHLLHLVAYVAHLRQNHPDLPQDADRDDPHLPTGRDPRPAVRDALPHHEADLREQGDQVDGGIDRCLLLGIVGGYPGILHDLVPRQSNPAHQHPGCHDHAHEVRRVVADALLRALRGLQALSGSDDADVLHLLVPTRMALGLRSRSVSVHLVLAGRHRADAASVAHPQIHQPEGIEVRGSRLTVATLALHADGEPQNGQKNQTAIDLDSPKQHEPNLSGLGNHSIMKA
jgi:hypothetical protein